MSIMCCDENMIILSHEKYLAETYSTASKDKIWLLFDICSPFRMDGEAAAIAKRLETNTPQPKKKKRKRPLEEYSFHHEVNYLNQIYSQFLSKFKQDHFPGQPSIEEIQANNRDLRGYVKEVMNVIDRDFKERIKNEDNFVIPKDSEAIICDIMDFDKYVKDRKYSAILLDPPWENKHVKRAKGSGTEYHMMDNQQIQEIPVCKLLNAEGLVLIWCSNNTRHREAIASWLRTWNLKQIAKWYWLKVTKYGELICDFSAHKNPYEILIIATTNNCDKWNDVPDNKVVISVPSGIHSHKPPLEAVINNYFPGISSSSRLELFARYLQPSWVSVGNEALKLNHSKLLN